MIVVNHLNNFFLKRELSQECIIGLRLRQLTAWEELFDQYAPAIYGIILQHVDVRLASGVLRDTFLTMYTRIDQYCPDKEYLFTWMYKLTLAACANVKALGDGITDPLNRGDTLDSKKAMKG